jgi:hypothetical protein
MFRSEEILDQTEAITKVTAKHQLARGEAHGSFWGVDEDE